MEDWESQAAFGGFVVFIVVLIYVIGRMLWNRLNGRDELDGWL